MYASDRQSGWDPASAKWEHRVRQRLTAVPVAPLCVCLFVFALRELHANDGSLVLCARVATERRPARERGCAGVTSRSRWRVGSRWRSALAAETTDHERDLTAQLRAEVGAKLGAPRAHELLGVKVVDRAYDDHVAVNAL